MRKPVSEAHTVGAMIVFLYISMLHLAQADKTSLHRKAGTSQPGYNMIRIDARYKRKRANTDDDAAGIFANRQLPRIWDDFGVEAQIGLCTYQKGSAGVSTDDTAHFLASFLNFCQSQFDIFREGHTQLSGQDTMWVCKRSQGGHPNSAVEKPGILNSGEISHVPQAPMSCLLHPHRRTPDKHMPAPIADLGEIAKWIRLGVQDSRLSHSLSPSSFARCPVQPGLCLVEGPTSRLKGSKVV
ncbi:hypothetical protein LY78DRAFT_58989 [Colletotrichum sublineola]|nr:hypothetical protein LY78DRAFT_58989 [Colletotrichum sublineola]